MSKDLKGEKNLDLQVYDDYMADEYPDNPKNLFNGEDKNSKFKAPIDTNWSFNLKFTNNQEIKGFGFRAVGTDFEKDNVPKEFSVIIKTDKTI